MPGKDVHYLGIGGKRERVLIIRLKKKPHSGGAMPKKRHHTKRHAGHARKHHAVGTVRKGWKKVKAGHGRHTWRKVHK